MKVLVVIAAVIILVLSGYAGWLLGRLWQQHRRRKRVERLRRRQALDSLDIIGRSLLADQVNVTEAALRMAVLLHNLEDPQSPSSSFSTIHTLANASRHLDTGTARQALPLREREIQDRQREALEARHGEAVVEATRVLVRTIPQWR